MNSIAQIYRAELIRAVLGPRVTELKVADPERLDQFAEHLAECEEAQRLLRAKGYGRGGLSFVEMVASLPNNVRQILRNLFSESYHEGQIADVRYTPEQIAEFYDIPAGPDPDA